MPDNSEDSLYAEYWPDGTVDIINAAESGGILVAGTSYDGNVDSIEEVDDFLRSAQFKRTKEWNRDPNAETYTAKVEFLEGDAATAENSGLETIKLIDQAIPDAARRGAMDSPLPHAADVDHGSTEHGIDVE